MPDIIFTITPQDAQLILDALVELPFKRVAELIYKLQHQATEQIPGTSPQVPDAAKEE